MQRFSGFRIDSDKGFVPRRWTGLSVTTLENLFIQVRNTEGLLLNCTIIVIQGGQIAGTYQSNPLNIFVEDPANLEIIAQAPYHTEQTVNLNHNGQGVSESVNFALAFTGYALSIRRR